MRTFLTRAGPAAPFGPRFPFHSNRRPTEPKRCPDNARIAVRIRWNPCRRWMGWRSEGQGIPCPNWVRIGRSSPAAAPGFRSVRKAPAPGGAGAIGLPVPELGARLFRRASESVTRGDRRERELRFKSPFPPLTARLNRRREDLPPWRARRSAPTPPVRHPDPRGRGSWRGPWMSHTYQGRDGQDKLAPHPRRTPKAPSVFLRSRTPGPVRSAGRSAAGKPVIHIP